VGAVAEISSLEHPEHLLNNSKALPGGPYSQLCMETEIHVFHSKQNGFSYNAAVLTPQVVIILQAGWRVIRRGAFDSAENHQRRQRRKRQSVTAKREKSQTPKFV